MNLWKWRSRNSEKTIPSKGETTSPRSQVVQFTKRHPLPVALITVTAIGILVFSVASSMWMFFHDDNSFGSATATWPISQVWSENGNIQGITNREAPSLGFRKGETLVYSFTQNRTIRLRPGNIAAFKLTDPKVSAVEMRVKQSGDLIVRVYEEMDQGWVIGFELLNARVVLASNQVSAGKEFERLGEEMKGEMLAWVLKSGRIQKLGEANQMSPEARNQWRDILARWQVVLADDVKDLAWTRTEEDTTGSYVASYARTGAAIPSEITKRKQHYLTFRGGSQASFTGASVIQGSTVIEVQPYQKLIEGRERMHITALGVDTDVIFAFRLKSASIDSRIDQTVSASRVALIELIPASSSWADAGQNSKGSKKAGAASGNIKDEIARLKQLYAEGKAGTPEEVNVLSKIADIIKSNDTSVDTVLAALAHAEPKSDLASALTGVLGSAGTPTAQLGLLAIATSKDWPHPMKQMALFSFAQVTQPVREVETWLQSLHEQQGALSKNAVMVLGAMGDRLRDTDPQRFNSIAQYVLDASNQRDLPKDQQIILLNAIGNLGPNEVPRFVQISLKNDDSIVRQEAVESLQRIQNDVARKLVLDSLKNDPIDNVRATAAKTLANSTWQGATDELMGLVNNDQSTQVRQEALIGLKRSFDENPRIVDLFQRVSERDRSPEVRELARQLLANHTTGD